jgi:hypothetical protein
MYDADLTSFPISFKLLWSKRRKELPHQFSSGQLKHRFLQAEKIKKTSVELLLNFYTATISALKQYVPDTLLPSVENKWFFRLAQL